MKENKSSFSAIWLLGIMTIIAACQSQVEKPQAVAPNKFADSTLVRIYDHQDKREGKALMAYLRDEKQVYRKEAALAMGSLQDTSAISILGHMLNDPSAQVRRAAAYSLGQTYDSAAISFLAESLNHEDSVYVRRELLEAMGKVVTQPLIATLYNQPDESVQDKEGLAWGLYRAGIRNVHDGVGLKLAVSLLDTANSHNTRLGAAHFLARVRNIDLAPYEKQIIRSATEDTSVHVRMAAAAALGKIPSDNVRQFLLASALQDNDYRVQISSFRALSNFEFDKVKEGVFKALQADNINVVVTATDHLAAKAGGIDALLIIEEALKQPHPRVKAALLGTALKLSENKNDLIEQIINLYNESKDPYYKADLLAALGNSLQAYEFLITKTFSEEHPAIGTAGITALSELRTKEDFPEKLRPAFADVFQQAVESGDIAFIALTSELLGNEVYRFKDEYESFDFLYEAKNNLSLPKDNEALQVLNKTIAYFEGKEDLPETKNDYNHPIDWELVKSTPRNQKAIIKTDKGDIVLRLLIEDAPGSVANFITLAQAGYFNDKNFHRVVPNFVIQGGCNRGDGYGGEDYSIRSEFANIRYQEGSVGMASAGKDTEGTQWFITHSATPHLDGRYTIFAQVTEGMDVVHKMEVGDKILSVSLAE